jgi:PAS domain S-box-containing protein
VRGCVVEWNRAAVEMFGFQRDEAAGRPLADLIVPEDLRDAHSAAFSRCVETGTGTILGKRVELRALASSGREFPIELTVTTYLVGDQRYFTAYLRDITDRHRRAAYSDVLDHAGRALLEHPLDPNRRIAVIPDLLVPRFASFAAAAIATAEGRADAEVLSARHATSAATLAHAVLSGKAAAPLWTESLAGDAGLTVLELDAQGRGTPTGFLRDRFDVSALAVCRIAIGDVRAAILCGAPDPGFSADDLRFLTEFCRRAELAVENATVYQRSTTT